MSHGTTSRVTMSHRARRRCLRRERLEAKECLTAVGFSVEQIVSESELHGAAAAVSADFDGDGDLDIVSAGRESILTRHQEAFAIAWQENVDGRGTFGPHKSIFALSDSVLDLVAADFDGDGDSDIVAVIENESQRTSKGVLFENVDGKGSFGEGRTVMSDLDDFVQIAAFDSDGDGSVDLFGKGRFTSRVLRFENDGHGNFEQIGSIPGSRRFEARDVIPGDVDQDGDMDVAMVGPDGVYFYENVDGKGKYSNGQLLLSSRVNSQAAFGDFDGDGDLDIVGSERARRYFWFENTGNRFGSAQPLASPNSGSPTAVISTVDIDGDSHTDIVALTGRSTLTWFRNTDGRGTFDVQEVIVRNINTPTSMEFSDLDGDGDPDMLMTSALGDSVAWYENDASNRLVEHRVALAHSRIQDMHLDDIDDDGDLDLFAASEGEFSYFINQDGRFNSQQLLANHVVNGYGIRTGDINGDGKTDVVSGQFGGAIAWYPHEDGGSFGAGQQVVGEDRSQSEGLEAIDVGDVDGDGDLDIFSASRFNGTIAWHENLDGMGSFGQRQIITDRAGTAKDVSLGDLDGDGDLDVLAVSWQRHQAVWFSNLGQGEFGSAQYLSTSRQPEEVEAVDIDQDGDLDVVVASLEGVGLIINKGDGDFNHVIPITDSYTYSLSAADFDGDGDVDIVMAHRWDSVSWAENDGQEQFILHLLSDRVYTPKSALAGDIDGDDDVDILYASAVLDRIVLRKNVGLPGDANSDGVFDSSDLVQMLQAGEYEDQIEDNSTLIEGDFDGDGDVTTSDLVFAFQHGNFVP